MDATVTFSKEFKAKTNKALGNVERRELRIKRLVEADKDGRLAKAKTRYDVGALAGFTEAQRTSGYLWTYHLIKDGILKEHIMNYTKDGHAEYEYHVSMPKKDSVVKKSSVVDKGIQEAVKEFPQVILPVEDGAGRKAVLRTNDITVELTGYTASELAVILKTLAKGE